MLMGTKLHWVLRFVIMVNFEFPRSLCLLIALDNLCMLFFLRCLSNGETRDLPLKRNLLLTSGESVPNCNQLKRYMWAEMAWFFFIIIIFHIPWYDNNKLTYLHFFRNLCIYWLYSTCPNELKWLKSFTKYSFFFNTKCFNHI